MEESAQNINTKKSILLSRNHPIAVIIGAAGFLGSHLTEKLLKLGVQVIGIDNLVTSRKENLAESFRHNNFHFLHLSIEDDQVKKNLENLPHLDYAVFIAENPTSNSLYKKGIENFLHIIKNFKKNNNHSKSERPKTVFISSVQIYDQSSWPKLNYLKAAENHFAKFVKNNNLNGRIVRLAEVYGPRMHFREGETFSRLIKASLENKLPKEETSLDFSTRGLFVDDAILLILKSILSGATSGKIFDGCLPQPVKVEEVKQILLNPHWHAERGFSHIDLPPWPTPNLDRSLNELIWKPGTSISKGLKETLDYFEDQEAKDFALKQKKQVEEQKKIKGWSFASIEKEEDKKPSNSQTKKGVKITFFWIPGLLVILLGLFYPLLSYVLGAYAFSASLANIRQSIEIGDLDSAKRSVQYARISTNQMNNVQAFLNALTKTGLAGEIKEVNSLLVAQNEGIEGISQSIEALDQSSSILEYKNGAVDQGNFLKAQTRISKTLAILADRKLQNSFLIPNRSQILDQSIYQYFYNLSEKGRRANMVLPLLFEGPEKTYLLLIGDNTFLQPHGGKLSQIGEIKFSKGTVLAGGLNPVSVLDQQLAQKNILISQNNLSTPARFSSLTSADFPTYAQNIKVLYQSLFNTQIDGVVMVDISLVDRLKKNSNSTDGAALSDLLTKSTTRQNIFKTARLLDQGLSKKKTLIFSSDNRLQAIFNNLNWEGSVKPQGKEEGFVDYLSVLENNQSLASNDQVIRKFALNSVIDQDGGVRHNLTISYDNQSSNTYLSSLQLVLPLGAKINSIKVGESATTFTSAVDFGRTVYTGEISINPGAEKVAAEYTLPQKLEIANQTGSYLLKVNKQPGSESEEFNWQLNYPFGWDLISKIKGADTTRRQINVKETLDNDQTFELLFKKN